MCSRRQSLFSAEWDRLSSVSSPFDNLAEKFRGRGADGRELLKVGPVLLMPAQAIGALALGALAVGALAVGAVAIGRLMIGRAQIRRVEIDELVVGKLRVTEEWQIPSGPPATRGSGETRVE